MLTNEELKERLKTKKYKRFIDPENAWLRVPKADIEVVGLQKKLTKKSKISEKYVFLHCEEDEINFIYSIFDGNMDAVDFIQNNIEFSRSEKPSFVNEYSEYSYYLL